VAELTDEERDFIRWWNKLTTYEKIMIGTPLPIPTGRKMVEMAKAAEEADRELGGNSGSG